MEDREVIATPLDLNDLFGGESILKMVIKGRVVRFRFVEKDAETDLEFQRRIAHAVRNRAGGFDSSDRSLKADLWLFDKLCIAVDVWEPSPDNPDAKPDSNGGRWMSVPDFRSRLSPDMKRRAHSEYNLRIQAAESEGN